MTFQRLDGVLGTRWMVPTRGWEQRRDGHLITAHHERHQMSWFELAEHIRNLYGHSPVLWQVARMRPRTRTGAIGSRCPRRVRMAALQFAQFLGGVVSACCDRPRCGRIAV